MTNDQKQLETMAHALIASLAKENGTLPTEQEVSETVNKVAGAFPNINNGEIQEVTARIAAGYRYHAFNVPSFQADVGDPQDGPLWTVIAGYEDTEGASVFHAHARDIAHLTDQMAEAVKEGFIDEHHILAIFKGALYSEV